MERGTGRTETTGSTTTIVAVIRGDDPVLRPGLPRHVRAIVCSFDGPRVTRAIQTYEVTFRYGLHWDVARVQSPLRLHYESEPSDGELVTR
ncbi:MAG TPA: hypothetical protein VF039_09390 [Longimicrobiales bacterium]